MASTLLRATALLAMIAPALGLLAATPAMRLAPVAAAMTARLASSPKMQIVSGMPLGFGASTQEMRVGYPLYGGVGGYYGGYGPYRSSYGYGYGMGGMGGYGMGRYGGMGGYGMGRYGGMGGYGMGRMGGMGGYGMGYGRYNGGFFGGHGGYGAYGSFAPYSQGVCDNWHSFSALDRSMRRGGGYYGGGYGMRGMGGYGRNGMGYYGSVVPTREAQRVMMR